ncbi:MAG: calcium-binding protein [Rheinheimera sp.]|nr:calcium-binding protein [Rheinheimera sp.]
MSILDAFNGKMTSEVLFYESKPDTAESPGGFQRWLFLPGSKLDPNGRTLQAIIDAYTMLKEQVFVSLTLQSRLKDVVNEIDYIFTDSGVKVDFTNMEAVWLQKIAINPNETFFDLKDFITFQYDLIQGNGWDLYSFFSQVSVKLFAGADFSSFLPSDLLTLANGNEKLTGNKRGLEFLFGGNESNIVTGDSDTDIILAGSGNDYLYGKEGSDFLYGESGNDTLQGGAGDDWLEGGAGNDSLFGGDGSDTYVFGRGDGQDVIHNGSNQTGTLAIRHDRILFKEGVAKEDVEYFRDGGSLVFRIKGTTDTLTFMNWFTEYRNDKLASVEFSDGSTIGFGAAGTGCTQRHCWQRYAAWNRERR